MAEIRRFLSKPTHCYTPIIYGQGVSENARRTRPPDDRRIFIYGQFSYFLSVHKKSSIFIYGHLSYFFDVHKKRAKALVFHLWVFFVFFDCP